MVLWHESTHRCGQPDQGHPLRGCHRCQCARLGVLPELLHGEEARVWGDSAYQGQSEAIRKHAPKATDFTNRRYRYKKGVDELQRAKNKAKFSVRAKVEHPLLIIKRIFGFAKTRYKGLAKNAHRLLVTCALANLYMLRRRLWRLSGV